MTAMPALFLSHGSPTIVIDDTPARHFLERLAERFERPRAIVLMSAHFETEGVAVVTDPAPEMIYDFRGFPDALYEMVYSAPGEPALAGRVLALLQDAGLEPVAVDRRGFDHGAWTTMKLAFPAADVPIVQVSVDPDRDAAWHFAIGAALAPLREDGILLIGSGHITHNLRAVFGVLRHGEAPDPELAGRIEAFTSWFADRFAQDDRAAILDWVDQAPFAADNHPTSEHLMPLFFAYGAGAGDKATRIHESRDFGLFSYDAWQFG